MKPAKISCRMMLVITFLLSNTYCSPSQKAETKFFEKLFKGDLHKVHVKQQQLFTGNGMLLCKGSIENVGEYSISATIGAGERVDMLGKLHNVGMSYDIQKEYLEENAKNINRNFRFSLSSYMSKEHPTFINEFNTLTVRFKVTADQSVRAEIDFKNKMPQIFYQLDSQKFNAKDKSAHLIPDEITSPPCAIHLAFPSKLKVDPRTKLFSCTNKRPLDYKYEVLAFAVRGIVRATPAPYVKVTASKPYGPFLLSYSGKKDELDLQRHWQHQRTFPLVKFKLPELKKKTALLRHLPTGRNVSIEADLECAEVARQKYLDKDSLASYSAKRSCQYKLKQGTEQTTVEIDGKRTFVGKSGTKEPIFIELQSPADGKVSVRIEASHSLSHKKSGMVPLSDLQPTSGSCSK